jgi:hypothetical protein
MKGSKLQTAKALGISRRALRLIVKYRLDNHSSISGPVTLVWSWLV